MMLLHRIQHQGLLLAIAALLSFVLMAPQAQAARAGGSGGGRRGGANANANVPRVPMESLKTLFFKSGARTMARRTPPRPQLRCVGSSKRLCEMYEPDMVVCKSMGDGAWKCDAELAKSVRMGAIEVSCEGWENADDEYVMRGSCGLEYNLLPAYVEDAYGSPLDGFSSMLGGHGKKSWYEDTFKLVFFAVVAFILFRIAKSLWRDATGVNNVPRGGGGGGGGGGGFGGGWTPGWGSGGGNDAPPPPYPGQKPSPSSSSSANTGQQQGWRPGFWTGMGLGGLAAGAAQTLFGGGGQGYQQERFGQRYAGRDRGSMWDTPSMTAQRRRVDYDDDNSFGGGGVGGGSGGFGAGPSGGTRTSTGFGGTRNR